MNRDSAASIAIPGAALVGFAAVAGAFRLRAYDLFWHLAAGRWIIEHRALPTVDPLRFSSDGASWVDHGWLFQVVARVVEQVAGLDGLVVLRALLVVVLAAAILIALRRAGAPRSAAVLVAAVAILGARPRLMVRPELLSLLGLGTLLFLLQEYRRARSWFPVVAAFTLVAVWANLHAGVLIAPAVAAAFLLGSRLPGGSGPGRGGDGRVGWPAVVLIPALLAAAVPINPFGWELYRVPFRIGRALRDLPAINPEWLPAWTAPQPFFLLGVAVLGGLVAYAALRTRRVDPATGLTGLLLAGLAVSGVRHHGLFFVGAAFLAGETLADLVRGSARPAPWTARTGPAVAFATCLLAALWCMWPPPAGPLRPRQGPYSFGLGIERERFPIKTVEALDSWPDVQRVYNDVAFGGYLSWRRYPRKVFIDGRNEIDPRLLSELALARSDSRKWNTLLERHGVDGALVRYDERLREVVAPGVGADGRPATSYRTSSALLFPAARFALVHWDDVSMLFVRRTPERAERLAREEYRYIRPEEMQATLDAGTRDSAFRAAAIAEIDRLLKDNPDCVRARRLKRELEEIGPTRP